MLNRHLCHLFLLPSVSFVLIFLSYPIVSNIWLSFTDRSLLRPTAKWIGLDNYTSLLTSSDFIMTLYRSLIWTGGTVLLELAIGLGAALLLYQDIRGSSLFRLLLIVPWMFPPVVAAIIWKWLLNGDYGIVNHVLLQLGLVKESVYFLATPHLAFPTVIVLQAWRAFPFVMLCSLAALQVIPQEQFEAAIVDGASAWQQLWYIILPNLRPVIGIVVILESIWTFKAFDVIYLVTGGGPVDVTETLPIYAYHLGWTLYSLGKAAALSVILAVVLITISGIYFRAFRLGELSQGGA